MEYLAIEQISGIAALIGRRFPPKTTYTQGNSSSRVVPQTEFVSSPGIAGQRVIRQTHPILLTRRKPYFACNGTPQHVTRLKASKQGLTIELLAIPLACSGFTRMHSPVHSRLTKTACFPIDRHFPQRNFPSSLCPAIFIDRNGQYSPCQSREPVHSESLFANDSKSLHRQALSFLNDPARDVLPFPNYTAPNDFALAHPTKCIFHQKCHLIDSW